MKPPGNTTTCGHVPLPQATPRPAFHSLDRGHSPAFIFNIDLLFMTKVGKNLQGQAASAAAGRRRRDADCAGPREGHGQVAGGPQSFVTHT